MSIVLVYGVFPRPPIRGRAEDAATHKKRAKTRMAALTEFTWSIDELRLKATEKAKEPNDRVGLVPGQPAFVRRKGKSCGSALSLSCLNPQVYLREALQKRSSRPILLQALCQIPSRRISTSISFCRPRNRLRPPAHLARPGPAGRPLDPMPTVNPAQNPLFFDREEWVSLLSSIQT